jgi:hypothetical protein
VCFKWSGAEWQYAGIQDEPGELTVSDGTRLGTSGNIGMKYCIKRRT